MILELQQARYNEHVEVLLSDPLFAARLRQAIKNEYKELPHLSEASESLVATRLTKRIRWGYKDDGGDLLDPHGLPSGWDLLLERNKATETGSSLFLDLRPNLSQIRDHLELFLLECARTFANSCYKRVTGQRSKFGFENQFPAHASETNDNLQEKDFSDADRLLPEGDAVSREERWLITQIKKRRDSLSKGRTPAPYLDQLNHELGNLANRLDLDDPATEDAMENLLQRLEEDLDCGLASYGPKQSARNEIALPRFPALPLELGLDRYAWVRYYALDDSYRDIGNDLRATSTSAPTLPGSIEHWVIKVDAHIVPFVIMDALSPNVSPKRSPR